MSDWSTRQVNDLPNSLSDEIEEQAAQVLSNISTAWPQGLIEDPKAKCFKAIAMDHADPPDLLYDSPDPDLLRIRCDVAGRGLAITLTGHRTARYKRTLGAESTTGELVIGDPLDGWGPLLRWVAFGEQS